MTWSYDLHNLQNPSDTVLGQKDQVRFILGDTNAKDPQLADEEILFTLSQRASIWGAAATCCESLAAKFSRLADTVEGTMRTLYSSLARSYHSRSKWLETKAAASGGFAGYSGGISWSDKFQEQVDPDRVEPEFAKGMTDNWIPVAPAGNETEAATDQGDIPGP